MTILAGEEVSEGTTLQCQKCNHQVKVNKGQSVPKCPNCGHDIFDEGRETED
jgi:DNA-directed RNA polymerase subunit RPC12/RpoP